MQWRLAMSRVTRHWVLLGLKSGKEMFCVGRLWTVEICSARVYQKA